MNKFIARIMLLVTTLLSGCAGSFLNPKPPVVEDKVGLLGREKLGTLATSADYRVVYVRLTDESYARICAEPSPDAAAEFSSAIAANIKNADNTIDLGAAANMTVAMKQLFRRTQGVQLYRDGSFALCNMYMNNAITEPQYIEGMKNLLATSSVLIEKEIVNFKNGEEQTTSPASGVSIDPSGKITAGKAIVDRTGQDDKQGKN